MPASRSIDPSNEVATTGIVADSTTAGDTLPGMMLLVTPMPLTTVRMPLERLGSPAVELLLERPADEDVREVVREPIELVLRESTAPPGRHV